MCHLVIAAPKLTMSPGGPPQPFVAPAPREHGTPQVALLGVPAPLAAPGVEEVIVAAAPELLPPLAPLLPPLLLVADMVTAVLALIVATTTPAQAPGLPHLPLTNPAELRLRELVAKQAAGTLTKDEEAELIALLAKVKGIHIQTLDDLNVSGPLRGSMVPLPGFHNISLTYTKRSKADLAKLRGQFAPVREKFLIRLGSDPAKRAALKKAGLTDAEISDMAKGFQPDGWQVHHKLPLDDGGDNSLNNLMLIDNDPYHLAITNYQNAATYKMKPGETRILKWPMFDGDVYP